MFAALGRGTCLTLGRGGCSEHWKQRAPWRNCAPIQTRRAQTVAFSPVTDIFATDEEKSSLYEAIGRAVASYSRLEHVAIELALVWDDSRRNYGETLSRVKEFVVERLADTPDTRSRVEHALRESDELAETRNAIVHGVWSEFHFDDKQRFLGIRTLRGRAAQKLGNPANLRGKALSTAELLEFAAGCESRVRLLNDVTESLYADMGREGGRSD